MSRIFWDTNLFIYLFEGHGPLSRRVAALRQSMLTRGDQLLTSALTMGEILAKPMEREDAELSKKYEETLTTTSLLIPFDVKAAKIYAVLRGDRSLRAPDAIQLACAAGAGVDLFITNDTHLHNRQIAGIQFIVSLEHAPL
jgi:predicted nucleic acid-binding protein